MHLGSVGHGHRTEPAVRAGLLIDHPSQRFSPGLRVLAHHPDLALRVYYWDPAEEDVRHRPFRQRTRRHSDLHSGYDWWAPTVDPTVRHSASVWRRGRAVLRRLRDDRPEVLLSFGWHSPVAWLGILHALHSRAPLLYYADAHPDACASGRRALLRRAALRRLFRAGAGAVATGHANRQFYLEHGLTPDQIHPGVLPADVTRFAAAAANRRPPDATQSSGQPMIAAYAGAFVERKAVTDLVEAAAQLPGDPPWQLWLIGDGPMRPELERQVQRHGLHERVRFLGFRDRDELPGLLAAVDVFVLPSRCDRRPLVVPEAMTAGAAVVVSSANGWCGPGDLVQHDETGFVYPAGDTAALAAHVGRLLVDPAVRAKVATSGQARARWCGPDDFAATAGAALVHTAREARRTRRPP